MASIASKLLDWDGMNWVGQFVFVTLTETFVDNSFDMSGVFCDHIKYVSPAVKLSYQGRRSGGVAMNLWKELMWIVTV